MDRLLQQRAAQSVGVFSDARRERRLFRGEMAAELVPILGSKSVNPARESHFGSLRSRNPLIFAPFGK